MDSGRHQLPGAKSSTISKWPFQYLTRLPHGRLVVGRCHLGMVRKSVYPDFFGPFVIICAPFSHPTAAHLSCTHLNGRKSLMCKKYIFLYRTILNLISSHFGPPWSTAGCTKSSFRTPAMAFSIFALPWLPPASFLVCPGQKNNLQHVHSGKEWDPNRIETGSDGKTSISVCVCLCLGVLLNEWLS